MKLSNSSYSKDQAIAILGEDTIYLVGLQPVTQHEYVDNRETDTITGFQVWVATQKHNPFKIKFPVEHKPILDGFAIGDSVTFEGLEAIQIKNNIYFRATKIKKG